MPGLEHGGASVTPKVPHSRTSNRRTEAVGISGKWLECHTQLMRIGTSRPSHLAAVPAYSSTLGHHGR